jgi:hypothetical protein
LTSVLWAILPACAVGLGLDYQTGVAAGLLGALDPLRHQVESDGAWDTGLSALALLGLVVLTFRWRNRFYDATTALGLGCLWGVSLLLQPAFLSILIALALLALYRGLRERRRERALRSVAVAPAAVALMIAPWLIRNDRVLGGFAFIRSNFGLELDVSNNDHASPDLLHNLHLNPSSNHPDIEMAENRRMAAIGELKYYRQRQDHGLLWIRSHRARFLAPTEMRWLDYWVPLR